MEKNFSNKIPYLVFGVGVLVISIAISGLSLLSQKLTITKGEEVKQEIQPKENQKVVVDSSYIDEMDSEFPLGSFLYVQKIGQTSTIYFFDQQSSLAREVLHFDERSSYDPTSGNLYAGFTPSADYSPIRNEIAYTSSDGLFLYSLKDKSTKQLIRKVGTSPGIDEIELPTWSQQELKGIFFFVNPSYSKDGNYLLFTGAFYEGLQNYVYDLSNGTVQTVKSEKGLIGRYDIDWSDEESLVIAAEYGGYTTPGLFIAKEAKFEEAKDILNLQQPSGKISFDLGSRARFFNSNQLIYSSAEISNDQKKYFINLIDQNGTNPSVILQSDELLSVEFVNNEKVIYSKGFFDNKTFFAYDQDTKESLELFSNGDYRYEIEDFLNEDIMTMVRVYVPTGKKELLFYSVKEKMTYKSPVLQSESGIFHFLNLFNQLEDPQRINISNVDQNKLSNYERCNFDFNAQEPNSTQEYNSLTRGIMVQLPYNDNWGNEEYYVDPYTEVGETTFFGPIGVFEGCSWVRSNYLTVLPKRSFEQIVSDLFLPDNASQSLQPIVKKIGELTIVEYHELGLCDNAQIEIIGSEVNYLFGQVCGNSFERLEKIVATVQVSPMENVFDNCGKIDEYQNYQWFSNFAEQLQLTLTNETTDVSEGCYSEVLNLFVFIIPAKECSSAVIGKYNVSSKTIYEAKWEEVDNKICHSSPLSFGNREGSVLQVEGFADELGCKLNSNFEYDFSSNSIREIRFESTCT